MIPKSEWPYIAFIAVLTFIVLFAWTLAIRSDGSKTIEVTQGYVYTLIGQFIAAVALLAFAKLMQ